MVHYSFVRKFVFLLSTLLISTLEIYAVVPVHINSGNPAYPFPQFLEYSYGTSHKLDNLGTINPEGVVHVEMEQDIRDAYQIFANEWKYTGETMDGVKYIRGNLGCPYDCREGDGYSMLAAAVMGDKTSFDGLWFRIHDSFRPGSKSYLTGETIGGGQYGNLIIGDQNNDCSATDGDNEIVMALYIAWRQWGDDSGHKGKNGEVISYKKDLIEVTRGLVAMYEERFKTENPRRVTTGDVGLDGYLKGGTTWAEVTGWATNNHLSLNGVEYYPEYAGGKGMHTDYAASAYYKEFYDLILELDVPESSEWEREQYRRCEASTDWFVSNWMSQNAKNIFWGEEADISADNVVTMKAGNQGGRFRAAWRTALNYVWHGNPTYTWDPVTHTVKEGGNTFEKESCERIAAFMNDPQGWNGPSPCTDFGGGPEVTYKGPSVLHWDINPDGTFPKSEFTLNWQMGTGMPAAIGAQDLDLAGILYRQCNIEWDCSDFGDGYLSSVPVYFHGFFRWLGMIIATGNHTAPGQIKAGANMKIYRAIKDSVTYAYTGDEITYLLDYRNFGTVDAENVVIVENVPADFVFVSASDGGVYDAGSHTITWKIGKVSGFKSDDTEGPALNLKSGNLAKTIGQVSYTCRIGSKAFGRYCTTADITCSNGSGWTTNEYPNYVTATMQRNCVDVIKRALKIEKSADREKVNPGNMVKYKIDFENSSEAGWLDGGRPRVTMAMSNNLDGSQLWLRFRLYNDAIEPYINYGNYRIAYYMYDSGIDCLAGEEGCSRGWQWNTSIYEGRRTTSDKVTVTHETIVEGKDDEFGSWNQRLCIQFAPLLVTTTAHISNYMQPGRVHKGGTFPLRLAGYLNMSDWSTPNFKDDWSWNAGAADAEDGNYHLISPSWQTIDPLTGKSIEQPITEYLPSICEEPSSLIENVLVEEYDGYAWRRILGTGPMAGREARNVVVIDTLPKGMEFQGFLNECPLEEYKASWDSYQIADGRWCVKWEIPVMQVKQKGTIEYSALASFPSGAECETDDELTRNVAWILADKNSPLSDTAEVTVTCAKVPEPIIPTTLVKTVDKENVQLGDDVTYTIEYEQTHGAVFDDALDKASDWTLSGASISGGALTTSQNQVATFKNSLSVNMYAEFDAEVVSYQEGEFFVRDDVRIQYKFNESTGLSVTCYEGSRKVTDATCALKNNPSRWKVKVTDDVLQVWFGKDTSASPAFTAEGLKVKEGRFGFRGVGYGAHKYYNIHIHTDYAYNLSIIDRKPSEISFVSADEGGELLGDSIVWKFEQGMDNPIPFGKKYTVTWKGTVDNCSGSIINIAYAKLLGHADNEIMAQAVSGCGEECPLPNVTLKISDDTICAGSGSVTLTAGPTGKYKYQFFEDGVAVTEVMEENTYEVSPIAAGKKRYSVVVTSGTTQLPCYSPSDTVALVIAKRPAGVNYDLETFCPGNANLADFDKAFEGYEKEGIVATWKDKDGKSVLKPSVNEINEAGTYSYTYLLTSKEGCESKNENTLDFTVKVISGPTGTGQVSYLLSDTAANGLFNKNLVQKDPTVVDIEKNYTYIWYDEDYNVLDGVPTPDVPAAGTTKILTYYVNRTQKGGCVSDTMTVNVIVSGTVVPVPNNVTYCMNETAEPITATLGEMEDSDSEWEIVYYDQYGNELDEADRVPNTSKGGKFTYYVSQREVGNPANESAKVPLTVTVVDIPLPDVSMNRTQYCKGEEYEQLLVESAADPKLKGSTFSWSIDGKSVEGVPVAQTQVETITYGVVESYKIDDEHVCQSDTAKLIVKTTFVPKPTGSLTVSYLKEDVDANGDFEPLLVKNPMLIAPADKSEYGLIWYDLKMNELDATDQAFGPILHKDAKWKENEDVKYSFYVRQHHLESGCYSDTVRIEVVISDALIPNTYPMNYCHMAKATSLESSASINTNNGQVDDIDYELLWFSPEDNYTNPLPSAPVPSTEEVGETVYKVAQLNVKEGKYGAMAELKVTVFPNPKLDVDKLPQTCGEEILISDYIHLANTVDTSLLNFYYFQDKDCTKPVEDMRFTETGTLYASAFYTIFSEPNIIGVCASDTMEINATIDDLSDLKVESPNSVCPNSDIELSATATSTTTEVLYAWSGDAESDKANFSVKDETGEFGHEYTFNLVASAGACHLDTTVKVKVGQGELTGAMKVNGDETKNFKSCGGEKLTLTTTHEGSDYKWSDLDGNNLGEGKEITVSPEAKKGELKYIVSLVNKCETTDTITVDVYPISVTADFEKLDATICEGGEASASLNITGFDKKMDGSYIKWFKDGEELTLYKNQTSITLVNASQEKSGEYSYEVNNGICLAKTDDEKLTATLKVQPYVKFTKPSVVEAPRGDAAELEIKGLEPSDAKVSWTGDDHTGEGNPFEVAAVTKDELFKVTLSADNYCDSETELQLLVDAKVLVSVSADNDLVCVDDKVILTADTTGTGTLLHPTNYKITWYALDENGENERKLSASGLSITDNPSAVSLYRAVVSYGAQNEQSEDVKVEVVSPAKFTKSENVVSCSGESVDIKVDVEEGEEPKIKWRDSQTSEFTLAVAPMTTRDYEFEITTRGLCPTKDAIRVDVKEKPEVKMKEEMTVCEDGDVIVSPTVTGDDIEMMTWKDPSGGVISEERRLETPAETSGIYTLEVTSASCGSATASVAVEVIPLPVLYLDSVSISARRVEVENAEGLYEYKLDKNDWQSDNLFEKLTFSVLHTAYAKDEHGCVGMIAFTTEQPPIAVDEYFTPGQGVKETWSVSSIMDSYPNSTVKIYDRTGKVLVELDGENQEWDGTYNGHAMPSTDYWYVLTVPEIRKQFKGHFTLIRGK